GCGPGTLTNSVGSDFMSPSSKAIRKIDLAVVCTPMTVFLFHLEERSKMAFLYIFRVILGNLILAKYLSSVFTWNSLCLMELFLTPLIRYVFNHISAYSSNNDPDSLI